MTPGVAGEQGPGGPVGVPEAAPSQGQTMTDLRNMLGAPEGQSGSGEQPMPAAEAAPGNTPEGQAQGAGPMAPPGMLAQTMIKGGVPSNRLKFQQQVGGGPPPAQPPEGG